MTYKMLYICNVFMNLEIVHIHETITIICAINIAIKFLIDL